MRCPSCKATNIAVHLSSMAVERPDGAWHYHALCYGCGQRLWWNARPGDSKPIIESGDHFDCAFFESTHALKRRAAL
jgi:hypothetical protein